MSESEAQAGDVFNIDRIRNLVELMEQHDLREVNLQQGEQRIQLKRGAETAAPSYLAPAAAPAAVPGPTSTAPAATPTTLPAEEDKNIIYIESPMVGTFYAKPNPESETYVKVGDHVDAETTVCIIEAMKVFNEIKADCNGRVVAVLVENEEPVDVHRKLFKVDTSQT